MGSVAECNDDNKGNIQWTWKNRQVEIIQSEEQRVSK